ncbi:ParB N-terminal domain-containing protein [Natrialba swarupiae]|uniref:ParB/Sulfiredoxin domain-containing protein n=1 Tax=Natrialba swarupiae TaxID=2448032 RepID=A0A5D5AJT2_9EURY|nr:hypothetical protein [Natrialba swarupiae]TYT62009.1 hypothetical protein FYC77_11090 [Natrialba swarupiae]
MSEVLDGDWDRQFISFDDWKTYNAFDRRFSDGYKWAETAFYAQKMAAIEAGEAKWGCTSVDDFEQRLHSIDQLYENIRSHGYKTQRQLQKNRDDDPIRRSIHDYWPPELTEITINVGRDGQLLLHDGRHRFIIASLLGLESIPARVKARHDNWQQRRDTVFAEPSNSTDRYRHPDLP